MNERIKQLAEQAGYTEAYYASDDGPFIEPEFNKEKFAELIVRKCVTAITDDVWAQGCESWAKGMRYSAEVIKEHFGVEE